MCFNGFWAVIGRFVKASRLVREGLGWVVNALGNP